MPKAAVAAFVILACATAAHADPEPKDPEPKDEAKLGFISGETAIDGYTLLLLGAIASGVSDHAAWSTGIVYASLPVIAIGPSIGHLVTGDDRVGGLGIATNAIGIGIGWAAISHENEIRAHLRETCPSCSHSETAFDLELGAAAVIVLGSGVFETVDTIRVVRRYNRRMTLAPLLAPTGGGVMLSGTF